MTTFVSLHNQTNFSILDSLSSTKDLFNRAKELDQPAIAITDHGTFGAAWEALKISKTTGVKLIIGCEFFFSEKEEDKLRHVILIAKNAEGYKNILTINRKGFDNNKFLSKKAISIINWEMLEEHSEGVICLTACGNGIVSQLLMRKEFDKAEETLLRLRKIYGDNLGIEVQPNNMKRNGFLQYEEVDQQFLNRQLINLGKKHNIKVVAACNSQYVNKEDHETHDVLLAIGSHQPVHSGFRLKYNVPEFYLKSGEEVKNFFKRNYGEEAAEEFCANSLYFANLCEEPAWIDPKFTNPSGKELAMFPVSLAKDYKEFLTWLETTSDFNKGLPEDQSYLRFRCETSFTLYKEKLDPSMYSTYESRINDELETLEKQNFSSYMLIVADYLQWCVDNDISIGPGRGCLTEDALALTDNGFKSIKNISIGDKVYSHTGQLKPVTATFEFDINNEKGVRIKSDHSFNDLVMTKDHKVYACKSVETEKYKEKKLSKSNILNKYRRYVEPTAPSWYEAKDLEVGDLIYTKFPNKVNIDLNLPSFYELEYSSFSNSKMDKKAKIQVDNDFMYFLGRFTGDGWLRGSEDQSQLKSYGVGLAFNSNDVEGINRFCKYFSSIGLKFGKYKSKTSKLTQIMIYNKSFMLLVKSFFPDYKSTSGTKHLPIFFRKLNNEQITFLLNGLIDSDGSKKDSDKRAKNYLLTNRWSIDSTSKRLILEVKEALLMLKTSSSIKTRPCFMRGKYSCNISYKLRFNKSNFEKQNGIGFYSRISSITEEHINKVYDFTVDEDHSYLTTNGIVHNSVGGCFVGFLLGIHQADSIKYGLIFERFQNKEKTSFPDIDADVATSGRYALIDYVEKKYGTKYVCAISNYNTITPKVYAKDLARALELGGSKPEAVIVGNMLADMIPAEVKASSIDSILERLPLLAETVKTKYPQVKKYGDIIGAPRAQSTHAAGIIIAQRPLMGLAPLRRDKDGSVVIEYDKDVSEANGFVKMDILGLSTLDIITQTIKLIKVSGKPFNNEHLNYDENDKKTYDLISRGETYGVFQFGTSGGTIELCKKIKPKTIDDLAIITTLARPAAADIRSDFIATREGLIPANVWHPLLKGAFEKTYGFGLFDESILQLGRDVAGWTMNEADRLRKMIKEKGKNPEKDKKLKDEFIQSTIDNNGIDPVTAKKLWDEEVGKFQSYTFNKSHAIVYSMISYSTAYLKAHFPMEFLIANLRAEVNSGAQTAPANIEKIKAEIRAQNINILPPDLNKSALEYSIIDGNTILTGLDAIKFVTEDAINDIIEKRPFKDFQDFMTRVDSKKVRSNTIQALAASGCLNQFGIERRSIFLYCSDYRKKLQSWSKKHTPDETFVYPFPTGEDWLLSEKYALEKKYLGESFICKPAKAYGSFFDGQSITIKKCKEFKNKTKVGPVKVLVTDAFIFKVKKEGSKLFGKNMARLTIEDKNGDSSPLTIFPDYWELMVAKLKKTKMEFGVGTVFSMAGSVNIYEDEFGIVLDEIYSIAPPPQVPEDLKHKKVSLRASKQKSLPTLLEDIEDELYEEGLIDLEEEDND